MRCIFHAWQIFDSVCFLLCCVRGQLTAWDLASQCATIGGDVLAHGEASTAHGPRCLKALEWCQVTNEAAVTAPTAPTGAQSRGSAEKYNPSVAPLSPEVERQCRALRDALMSHKGLLTQELEPRGKVLQQVGGSGWVSRFFFSFPVMPSLSHCSAGPLDLITATRTATSLYCATCISALRK